MRTWMTIEARGREEDGVRAERARELHAHVAESAETVHADLLPGPPSSA